MNIAFVGKAGSGKTYLAKYLVEKYGYIHAKMATGVYAIAQQYFGMKEKDRKLLQFLGTDVGRTEINNDLWVQRFLEDTYMAQRTYKELYHKEVFFCADDIRFKNEAQQLLDDGWCVIYLDVPEETRIKRLGNRDGDAQVSTLGHISETEIETFKDQLIHLDSSGTLDETYQKLEILLQQENLTNK